MNMYDSEKSDRVIVPKKVANKQAQVYAESLEGRTRPKGNRSHEAVPRTQSRTSTSTGLAAVRRAASKDKKMRFTALLHHLSVEQLRASYFSLKKNAAPGLDGLTWEAYGENLEKRLKVLHNQIHKGSYKAQPAKRSYIPKADGSQRPLSIWCLEDKIIQQAIVEILNAVYEIDFQGFSYGFRPGKGQHHALDALAVAIHRKKVNWILDADIEKFFDHLDHEWLEKFLEHRIGDQRILRLIKKWMRVGIWEDGQITRNRCGVPQGAVISPLLANIYLHYVYDLWVKLWRKKKARGDLIVIRYADDTVVGFQYSQDAEAFLKDLKQRLEKFGLCLHPKKTRLIRFGRYARDRCNKMGQKRPDSFDFLGFTHYCGKSWKTGWFVLGRKTINKRMRAQLQEVKVELRRRLHRPTGETGRWLNRVLMGHLNYYGVPGNGKSLNAFFKQVCWYWIRSLRRRSQRNKMTWDRFSQLRDRFIPKVRIIHPHPWTRFSANTQGRSPVR